MSAGKFKVRKPQDLPGMELTKFDRFHQAVTVIGAEHRSVHDGFFWRVSNLDVDVIDNGQSTLFYLDVPPGVFPHIRMIRTTITSGPIQWWLYEDVQLPSPEPAELQPHNSNRNTADSPGPNMRVYHDAIGADNVGSPVANGATELTHQLIPSGTNARSGVVGDDPGEEWVLAQNTTYLLRVENISAGANEDVHLQLLWYELAYGQ